MLSPGLSWLLLGGLALVVGAGVRAFVSASWCPNGHIGWGIRYDGYRFCKRCGFREEMR